MNYFFTDGATSKNGSKEAVGAWAWAQIENDEIVTSGWDYVAPATNNRCELLAVIHACTHALAQNKLPATIYSDSAYIVNCYNQKWYKNWKYNGWVNSKREPVANKDLWEKLIPFFEDKDFIFTKVKGHNGVFGNEVVDTIAKQCITNMRNDKC